MKDDIYTDVLIVGSGVSGLFAAKHCSGVNVTLISKNNFLSSNSFYSPWNMRANHDQDFEFLKTTGQGMGDDALLRAFVGDNGRYLDEFKELGIQLRKTAFGYAPIGNKYPGRQILEVLIDKLSGKVDMLSGTELVSLLNDGKGITGAVVKHGGTYSVINAKSVILASGGIGGMFENTTNMPSDDGSAIGAAFRIGTELVNPEFQMFHPFLLKDSRVPNVLFSGEMLPRTRIVDEDNKEFLEEEIKQAIKRYDYHHVFPKMVKDIYQASKEGKIYLDFGEFSRSEYENFKTGNEYGWLLNYIDIGDRIRFVPAEHYFVGGVRINERCETNVKGLYACGECSGGLHGANRVGGNGINEGIIFGRIAAEQAVANAKNSNRRNNPDVDYSGVSMIKNNDLNTLKKIMWNYCSVERNEKGLNIALSKIEALGDYNQTLLAKLIAYSSLIRRESIGVFSRSDYPGKPATPKNNYISIDYLSRDQPWLHPHA